MWLLMVPCMLPALLLRHVPAMAVSARALPLMRLRKAPCMQAALLLRHAPAVAVLARAPPLHAASGTPLALRSNQMPPIL